MQNSHCTLEGWMEPNKVHLLNNHPTFASVAALIFFSQLTQRHRCRKEDEKDVCSFFTLKELGGNPPL